MRCTFGNESGSVEEEYVHPMYPAYYGINIIVIYGFYYSCVKIFTTLFLAAVK